jgi:hypothetical protein
MVAKQHLILLTGNYKHFHALILCKMLLHLAGIVEIRYLNILGMLLWRKGFEENVVCCKLRIRLTVKIIVFWNVTPCSPVETYESCKEMCCF